MSNDAHARHAVGRRTVGEATLLGVAAAGAFLAFLDATIVNVAFPDIRATFPSTSISGLSWVLNAYNIVFAAFLVAAGRMCDLLGRRRVFAWGVGLFTAASAACAAAGSVEMLVAFRAIQALGAAVLVPASLALVIEGFPPSRRAHGVGLWGAAAALAAGLGPPIGGAVVEASGWRLTFLINVPLGIATILASRRILVESRAPGRRTLPDLRGAAVLAGAIGTLTLGIVEGNDWGWTDPRILGAFAVAVVFTGVFVERSTWHPSPIIDPALVRIRAFGAANALTVVAGMGFYAYLLCHILYLTTIWRYGILEAGFAVMPGAIVATLAAGIVGRLADRHDPRLIIGPGALVWSAALWWYVSRVGLQPHFLTEWLPGQVLSGLGVGATLPVLGTTAFAAVPGGRYATAASVVSSARQLGGVLGIAILVVIIGHPTFFDAADVLRDGWRFSAICFLAVAVGTPAIGRLRRFAEEDEKPPVAGDALADRPPVARPLPAAAAVGAHAPANGNGNGNGNGHRRLTAIDVLRAVPVFAGTGEATVRRIAETAESVAVAAGEWLFHEGDPGDAVYVVRSGRLEVVKGGVGIGLVGRGDVIGELALLTEAPRSASIRAVRDTELLRVGRERFRELIAAEPGAMLGLTRMLADRIRVSAPTAVAPAPRPGVVAIVALDSTVPARAFCGGLADALRRHGTVAVPDRVDPESLERAERDHDRVLLLAGTDAEGRAACLRQADRVVALARPTTVLPDAATCDALRGCDLVWAGARPDRARLAEWTAALAPRQHHVVRGGAAGLADGAGALARRLAGRSVGLVLSGGGARALAHLGVIEELHAAGVRIERVGGCSMGAFIGALHARGWDPPAIDACVYEEFVRRNPINDYRLPSVSLVRGRKGRAMLERVFGEGIAEELEHEFFCVSCDLRTRELVEHRTGLLADALGATMCLPGIFPPQVVGDRLLVDGGVLNNLPVDVLAARDEGPIIAVDVTERFEAVRPEELLDRVSRRNDRAQAAAAAAAAAPPNIKETLVRSLTLASVDTLAAAREHSALLVSPAVDDVGVLEFHMIDRMREAGRAAARAALADAPPELWW